MPPTVAPPPPPPPPITTDGSAEMRRDSTARLSALVGRSVWLSGCLSVWLSVCLAVCLAVCLSGCPPCLAWGTVCVIVVYSIHSFISLHRIANLPGFFLARLEEMLHGDCTVHCLTVGVVWSVGGLGWAGDVPGIHFCMCVRPARCDCRAAAAAAAAAAGGRGWAGLSVIHVCEM